MKHFKVIARSDCPFCVKAKELLKQKEEQFEFRLVDDCDYLLQKYKTTYNYKTVPIVLLVGGDMNEEKLIGGYTDLVKFFDG